MHKELKLQDRLRVAKHFNAAFELQPEQVDWIDAALTQLRSNKIEQTSADVAYQQLMLKKADHKRLKQLITFSAINAAFLFVAIGVIVWLM